MKDARLIIEYAICSLRTVKDSSVVHKSNQLQNKINYNQICHCKQQRMAPFPHCQASGSHFKIPKSQSASTHANCQFCKVSLSLENFEIFDIFAVPMVTAAILKIPTPKCNSAYASYYSCKVSSSLQHLHFFLEIFDLFALFPW